MKLAVAIGGTHFSGRSLAILIVLQDIEAAPAPINSMLLNLTVFDLDYFDEVYLLALRRLL